VFSQAICPQGGRRAAGCFSFMSMYMAHATYRLFGWVTALEYWIGINDMRLLGPCRWGCSL
jgi:hypothetical protein